MKFPPIPTGPVTIGLNGFIMDTVFRGFVKKYLPAYEVIVTSDYRTPAENEEAQGTDFSAHMYNLARDFALKDNKGNLVSAKQLKALYEQFVEPNWPGYSYYNNPVSGSTGWIHLNLDRWITDKTKFAEIAVGAVTVGFAVKKIIQSIKSRGGKSERA